MSVWLTPDLKPFVGATYFPPEDQVGGRPGFRTILNHISKQVCFQKQIDFFQHMNLRLNGKLPKKTKSERIEKNLIFLTCFF